MNHSPSVKTSFFKYPLAANEILIGHQLPILTMQVIQNIRADIAEQKINLEFTPNDVLSYTQQEAFLKGQLEILQHLLDASEESMATIAATPQTNQN